ncbi:unnamed protein product, partial [Rotaria magnacalcarata]
VRNAEINREHEVFIDGDDIDSYLDTSDDSNDEIQMIKVYDLDEEEINPIARYSPENQLKFKIGSFIRDVNMNKKHSNMLLDLLRGMSKM